MSAGNRLRIGYLSTLYHSSILIKGSKSLEKSGIEPTWKLFGTGPAIIDAFSKGALDVGYIGLAPTLIGIARGVKVKCMAGGHVEGTVIVGKKEFSAIEDFSGDMTKTLRQLEGKRVGVPRKGSLHDVFLRHYLSKSKVNNVSVVNYEWADLIPDAMQSDEIDAACGTPPLAILLSRLMAAKIMIPPRMIWPNNPSYGIVTNEAMLAENSELLSRFLSIHKDVCCSKLHNDREGCSEIVATTIGLVDSEFVLDVYNVSPKYCASLSPEFVESTQRLLPALKELGYLTSDLTKNQIFDFDLIKRVHPEDPHYSA